MSAELRNTKDRVAQTLWFEGVGLALVTPLYGYFACRRFDESLALLVALSLTAMAWAGAFNTAFDRIESRVTRRAASDRPRAMRVVHALAHEITLMAASCPLIVALTHSSWLEALRTDLVLTSTYVAYAYAFHVVFDRIRPVGARALRRQETTVASA